MTVNRLLTDNDRINLAPLIANMWKVCPDMMKRKIDRANVQQAFVLDTILKEPARLEDKRILSAGCYDDTAYEYLKVMGFNIFGVDPAINMDLHTWYLYSISEAAKYDIVFSTSVLEHVANDLLFVEDMCLLLNKGGLGVLTMDFNNNYKPGDRLPATDLRFYTKYDLDTRLRRIIEDIGCEFVDEPNWEGEPEFIHDGCNYSFATFVFRKKPNV